MPNTAPDRPVADSTTGALVRWAPPAMRPYLRLARVDRPIGFWLLMTPCWVGLALARLQGGWVWADAALFMVLTLGAVLMRGAGCTYNDIIDKDLDASVARTADRPLAAGTISIRAAGVFLALQVLGAFALFMILPRAAQLVALGAIPIIAAYPFMKRITWFPQAWLGFAMNWGALVAYAAATGAIDLPAVMMFIALWAWTFGYDTIYAHQDKDDDALVGVKSTARLFGRYSRLAVGASYLFSACFAYLAVVAAGQLPLPRLWGAPLLAYALALTLQVVMVRFDVPGSCLRWFKFNRETGLLLWVGVSAHSVLSLG